MKRWIIGIILLWPLAAFAGTSLLSDQASIQATVDNARILVVDGTIAAPSISFVNDTDTGFFRIADGLISLANNGVVKLRFVEGIVLGSQTQFGWTGSVDPTGVALDVSLLRDSANTLALRNAGNLQTLILGQGNAALAGGQIKLGRDASVVVAPGAGLGMFRWEAGTTAGTLKLVAYSGTSVTGVTLADNVGAGN